MAQPNKQDEPAPFVIAWGDATGVPLVVGDLLHWRTTGDRCYLTVGQMNLPISDAPIPPGSKIDVQPVVRIMLTPQTLQYWAAIIGQAAAQFTAQEGIKK